MADRSQAWSVLLETVRCAQTVVTQWMQRRQFTPSIGSELTSRLQRLHEAYCLDADAGKSLPELSGYLPPQANETQGVRGYRAGMYVLDMLEGLREQRLVSLSQYHALKADAGERLQAVERTLLREGLQVDALAVQCKPRQSSSLSSILSKLNRDSEQSASSAPTDSFTTARAANETVPDVPATPPAPRRNIMELLLDPRSIQILLGLGGALMVVGLVILLWLNNFFTPPVTAAAMAVGSVAMLAAGLAVILKTRYQMAGKAVALLACAVLPLNLWYLHANNLITLDGHLWMAGVLISGMYAAAAWILKDKAFVGVFCGGVTLTGLLIIADLEPSPQKFWEIARPSTLLIVLGLIGIHLERAFTNNDGPFNRRSFGMAFFWSGHAQLAAGLLLLLGATVSGDWMYGVWFKPMFDNWNAVPSPVCGPLRWFALVLVLAGTYAYLYSDIVVRRRGIFVHFAGFTLLWAQILIVQLLHLELGLDAIIAIMAVTAIAIHLTQKFANQDSVLIRSFPAFGVLLSIVPVLIGIVVYLDNLGLKMVWASESPRWTFVGAVLLAAASCRLGAFVSESRSQKLTTTYFFGTGAAAMVAAVAAFAAMGLNRWQSHAPLMMLLPLAWLVASRLYGTRPPAEPLWWVAQTAAGVMLVSSFATSLGGFFGGDGTTILHLSLALFFAEAAVFYVLTTWFRREAWSVFFAAFMSCACLWQILAWFGFSTQVFLLAFAFIGLAMLIAYRLSLLDGTAAAPMSEALFLSANAVLSLSFVSAVLYGLSQVARDALSNSSSAVNVSFALFAFAMLGVSIASAFVTNHPGARHWFIVTSVGLGIVALLALHGLINLSPWQQVELFLVLTGLGMLLAGHLGWFREQERESDTVSMCLLFGSLLASAPLALATWIDRGRGVFFPVNEFGFLFISIALLVSGVMLQLKSTTLIGGLMTVLYFATLLIFVPWGRLNTVALAILIGGGVLFGTGLALAFFRDRLITLPDRFKRREGIYRVFNWR